MKITQHRKSELYSPEMCYVDKNHSNIPAMLYKQERDWTSSLACIKTILSGIKPIDMSEDFIIDKYGLIPGYISSYDIYKAGIIEDIGGLETVYGYNSKPQFDDMLNLMDRGYYIMANSTVGVSHWMVFMAYFPEHDKNDREYHKMLFYDPYYDNVRLINADEFIHMWRDTEHTNVNNDIIAVRN